MSSRTLLLFAALAALPAAAQGTEITLDEAAARALAENPQLAVYGWELRAADARILQAGLRPNPTLSVEVEEIRWRPGPEGRGNAATLGFNPGEGPSLGLSVERETGSDAGFSNAEITTGLSQTIELGGKRVKRLRHAQEEKEASRWDYEAARADLVTTVKIAFANLQAAQERLAMREELLTLAGELVHAATLRVDAGKVSPLERNRAEVTQATARADRADAEAARNAAKTQLAALWGGAGDDFDRATGQLPVGAAPPSVETLLAIVEDNPDLRRWTAEIAAREAAHRLERANAVPDLEVEFALKSTATDAGRANEFGIDSGGGIDLSLRRGRATRNRDHTLTLGFSIPIPIFNRNQGAILESEYLTGRAEAQRHAEDLRIRARLTALHQKCSAAYQRAQTLRNDIVPRAEDAFGKAREGYREGKFNYLDVLDAQREYFDTRNALLDARLDYHQQRAELERLAGVIPNFQEASDHE